MIAELVDVSVPRSIDKLLETTSATRLQTFHQCRLKFYFRYVLGLKKARTPALFVGSMVHSVLQQWNLARWREGKVDPEKLKTQLDQQWKSELKKMPVRWDQDEEPDSKKETWSLFEIYLNQTPIPLDERPEAVEVAVEADLSRHSLPTLIGMIDLVRRGGRIVDFKTTGQTPNPEKAEHMHETQLSCYALTYRDATGKKETALELHHLVKLKKPKLVVTAFAPMTENQQTRLFRIIESYVNGIQNEDWVPSPNAMSCSCCEFFNECRRWK
jgi:CRISPR/Cas system-associated exonuclease Cas4 (RecB family)